VKEAAPVGAQEPASVTGQLYSPGLEGIVAARTAVSDVNGRTGKLLYRGFDIAELAEKSNFEETCFLLYTGRLPSKSELDALRQTLGRERVLPPQVMLLLKALDPKAIPMDLLRTGVSALAHYDADVEDMSAEANIRKAHRLVGQTATLVATIGRLHRGLEPIEPDPSRTIAGDFLRMYSGEEPDPLAEKVFDVCLILHADHGMNASTFTARVIASTLSDMHSAVVGAIGALKGPLHGGANAAVMEMLRGMGPRRVAEQEARNGLRTPRLQGLRSSGDGAQEVQQAAGRARRRAQVVRHVGEGREGRARGQEAQPQCRLLLRQHLPRHGAGALHLHPDLRAQPDGRLDRARP
jgi:citrate synthase